MMDSSCKNPVSPVDAVSVSMNTLSLLNAPTDESMWPQRNCMTQTIECLYPSKSDSNSNFIARSIFGESKHILDVPSVIENENITNSNCCDKRSGCESSSTGNSDDKSGLGECFRDCRKNPSQLTEVMNSSIHEMILRPRTVSPRHCIITLYDDSESEESSDSDYTVDLDECNSTSSDEETDSCEELTTSEDDSLHSELAIEEMRLLSTGESSDSDEVTTDSSSSDEDETEHQTKESSGSEEQTADSSSSDEEAELSDEQSSDSEEHTSSSSDEEAELPTKESSDSDKESSNSDEETEPPTKQSSDSDEESTKSSRSDKEKEHPKRSSDSDEDGTESSSHYEEMGHPTEKSPGSARNSSLLNEDSEECDTSLTESHTFNEDQVTSENDSAEFSKNQLNEQDSCLASKLNESGSDEEDSSDSDSSVDSNPTPSECDSETTTDKSISLGESTEYSSEESNASG